MNFEHPDNGHVEKGYGLLSWLWVLLFGPIYWAVKGVWRHVVASILLGFLTFGISHLIYPFFTYSILRKHYLRTGWRVLKSTAVDTP